MNKDAIKINVKIIRNNNKKKNSSSLNNHFHIKQEVGCVLELQQPHLVSCHSVFLHTPPSLVVTQEK